jgi:hypothetical protein
MSGYDIDPNNRMMSDGVYNYQYDDEGNRTRRTNITTGDYTEYEWDHRNRLTNVTEYDDEDHVLSTVEQTYDVFNQWIGRSFDDDGPGGDDPVETYFAYEAGQIVLQFDGDSASDLSHRYLWGPAVDQILADESVCQRALKSSHRGRNEMQPF